MIAYETLVQALEYIRAHPSQYNFMAAGPPDLNDSTPCGCLLGWIGHFAEIPFGDADEEDNLYHPVAQALGYNGEGDFYNQMRRQGHDILLHAFTSDDTRAKCIEAMVDNLYHWAVQYQDYTFLEHRKLHNDGLEDHS